MFATQVLLELPTSDDSEDEIASEIVGYFIVDDKKFEVKKGETKIGRDSSTCSIVIENFTLSKIHAVIESEGIDDTFIYDAGSTNQTKLGKKFLRPHCRYKLDNESKITLGNIIAKFVIPSEKILRSNLETKKTKPDQKYLNPLDELGDIFDVATQVTAPQSSSTGETFVFAKNNDKIHNVKNSNSVFPTEKEKLSGLPICVFDEATQSRLASQKKTSKAEYYNTAFENSGIFSANTQFQLYEPSKFQGCDVKKVACDNYKKSKSDKTKSLLNDGQDDMLCTFMSLHSPKEQNKGLSNKAAVKTEIKNLSQVLNVSTQLQAEVIQELDECDEIKVTNLIRNDILNENFSINKPSTTSTPLNQAFQSNFPNNYSEVTGSFTHMEEDFLKTKEFNVHGLTTVKKQKNNIYNLSQDEETQPCIKKSLNDSTIPKQQNDDEDLILTQTFEAIEKSLNKKTIIPESEDLNASDDDFIQTQIYDVEKNKNVLEKEISTKANVPVHKKSDKDLECHLNDSIDLSQRNNQDDFIVTQVFEEIMPARKKETDLEKNNSNSDEDFISTQPVELLLIKSQNNRNSQKRPTGVKTTSRESSPDLLGLEDGSWKNTEDCTATQIFEEPKFQKFESSLIGVTKQTNLNLSSYFEFEKDEYNIARTKVPDIVDSSGDETESDLEILLDKDENRSDKKFGENAANSFKAEPESEDSILVKAGESVTPENNSSSSYIFTLESENHLEQIIATNNEPNQRPLAELNDSDATDCEELGLACPKIVVKQEPLNKIETEETQVLTLTLPNDFAEKSYCSDDDWMIGEESPKFGMENKHRSISPLSLEMPSTQEIESTVDRLLQCESEKKENFEQPSKTKKREVGINISKENNTPKKLESLKRQVDSPLKRPLDNNITDIMPPKKSKIETLDRYLKSRERQFSKLVQVHDIGQIQPSRTRNSLKMFANENNSNKTDTCLGNNIVNERSTSRRKANTKRGSTKKINGDITSFLTKKVMTRKLSYEGRKKETPPKENKEELKLVEASIRILRSSRKNYGHVAPTSLVESPNKYLRRSKRNSRTKSGNYFSNSCVHVVFTGFDCESLDKIIYGLGGKKTNDLSYGEVVVADKIRRTVKFLCAMGLGLPITSPQWLLSCEKEKTFLNPWNFILKDEESEEKWDFNLKTSLEKSKKMKLLQGFSIYATKNTQPPVKDLLAIIECCGGIPLSSPPDVWPKNTIVVSCLEDKKWWPPKKRNIKIVHYEFILSGVLKQKIDFKTYILR